MFSLQERMLSVVPRWSGLPRLHQQNVAEHSFYVALYTDKLCREMGWPVADRYGAVAYALIHDMAEATTGDIMGPVKRRLVNKVSLSDFEDEIMEGMGPYYKNHEKPSTAARIVVKAANIIDEYFHISLELAMGNNCMKAMQTAVLIRMEAQLTSMRLERLLPNIVAEGKAMMNGISFVQENSDVAMPDMVTEVPREPSKEILPIDQRRYGDACDCEKCKCGLKECVCTHPTHCPACVPF